MKRFLVLLAMLSTLASAPAYADNDISEGFAATSFRELMQTFILMGGMDLSKTSVADEYGRLAYCDVYQKNFSNDIAWNEARQKMLARIAEKKEYYRILYETVGVFKLGRYDFERKFYPVTRDTAIINVGEMILISPDNYEGYCGLGKSTPVFPIYVNLILKRALTIDRFEISEDNMRKMLTRMEEMKNKDRFIYARVRLRVKGVIPLVVSQFKEPKAELRGEVLAIDMFLDKGLTQPVGSVPVIAQD